MNKLDKIFAKVNKAINIIIDGEPNDEHNAFEFQAGQLIGKKLYSTQGTADWIWNDNCIRFAKNGDITDDNDCVYLTLQKGLSVKQDSSAILAVKWRQNGTQSPTFTYQYRLQFAGSLMNDSWSSPINVTSNLSNEVYERDSGVINQITKIGEIDWSSALPCSELEIRITRSDSANPKVYVTTIGALINLNQSGGREEWNK